jgi:hypothetical protein
MVVIGGKAGVDVTGTVEVFNPVDDTWQTVPELTLREPRYSFCAVPGKALFPPLFVVFALLFEIRAHAQGAALQFLRRAR